MLEPLKSGRLINHLPFGFSDTEWTETDPNLEQTAKDLNLELLHIPMQDACPPVKESVDKLLTSVKDFLSRRPNEKIYVHCWRGSGRTSVLLAVILHSIYKLEVDKAVDLISQSNFRFRLSEKQEPYLKTNLSFPYISETLYDDLYKPEIRTPKDHECWKTK